MAKGKQRGRPVTVRDVHFIEVALDALDNARSCLRDAGSNNAANYVQRAMKSTQGALNNARAHLARQERHDGK
jgi:hypothetical protein